MTKRKKSILMNSVELLSALAISGLVIHYLIWPTIEYLLVGSK